MRRSMASEFLYPYVHEIAEPVGLLYYGCCEAVHQNWDDIRTLPHLRKVSISQWTNEPFMGEALRGTGIVYSRKPNPNFLSVDRPSTRRRGRRTSARPRPPRGAARPSCSSAMCTRCTTTPRTPVARPRSPSRRSTGTGRRSPDAAPRRLAITTPDHRAWPAPIAGLWTPACTSMQHGSAEGCETLRERSRCPVQARPWSRRGHRGELEMGVLVGGDAADLRLLRGGPVASVIREQVAADVAAFRASTGSLRRSPSWSWARMRRPRCTSTRSSTAVAWWASRTGSSSCRGRHRGRHRRCAAALQADPRVAGIIAQMPLPKGIPLRAVIDVLDPMRDIDGIHPLNAGLLSLGYDGFLPATAHASIEILKQSGIESPASTRSWSAGPTSSACPPRCCCSARTPP